MTEDEPNRAIAWKSVEGNVGTSGEVTFAGDGSSTEVHVILQWYDTPGGVVGEAASRLLRDPAAMLEEDLQRFKELVETEAGSSWSIR